MTKPKLTYFDISASRGEECRLALHIAGIDFEDVRIKFADWPATKSQTPYGAMPMFELPGKPAIGHSNAILVLIGRQNKLHPSDAFEAAQHEGMMNHVEDMRAVLGPTTRMADAAEKKKVRETIASEYLPSWGAFAEKNIATGPFFGGSALNVVDLKVYMTVKWILGGKLDHIPTTVFNAFPKLMRTYTAVSEDTRVVAWYSKSKP
jgi:prostaglandin-H2 D-isomerase / glutathione transferase